MKNLGFVITGRMKSTRLREKLILPLQDREVIAQMVDRAKETFQPSNIVIATSENPQDDILERIAERESIKIFRGHEDDVITRIYNAAVENKFDYFVNITADCPLFGFDYIEELSKLCMEKNSDLVTSLDLPHGIFVYLLKTAAIKKVIEMKKSHDTEVWGDYFYKNPQLFTVTSYEVSRSYSADLRLTLDYPEDYEFFKAVYDYFGKETYKVPSSEIISYLEDHPEVVSINKDCKALYLKRWESQRVNE